MRTRAGGRPGCPACQRVAGQVAGGNRTPVPQLTLGFAQGVGVQALQGKPPVKAIHGKRHHVGHAVEHGQPHQGAVRKPQRLPLHGGAVQREDLAYLDVALRWRHCRPASQTGLKT